MENGKLKSDIFNFKNLNNKYSNFTLSLINKEK